MAAARRVEFAIKLPGDENGAPVWLPIDAKFPIEDYHRLIAAQEEADPAATDEAMKSLETQLRRARRTFVRNTSIRRGRRISLSCFCRPRDFMRKRSGGVGLSRAGAARVPSGLRWADHAGGVAQQFADGIPHARDPETVERSLELARHSRRRSSENSAACSRGEEEATSRPRNKIEDVDVRSRAITKQLRAGGGVAVAIRSRCCRSCCPARTEKRNRLGRARPTVLHRQRRPCSRED